MKPPLPHGLRETDSYGSGVYGAPRVRDGINHPHYGIDFRGTPGESVIAPCYLLTKWFGYAYPGDTRYSSFHAESLEDLGLMLTIFYMLPKDDEGELEYHEGDVIGEVQDLRLRYPADANHATAITPHIHVQLTVHGKLIDPTPYFFHPRPNNG